VADLAPAVEWVTGAAPDGNLKPSFNLLSQGESHSNGFSPFLSFPGRIASGKNIRNERQGHHAPAFFHAYTTYWGLSIEQKLWTSAIFLERSMA